MLEAKPNKTLIFMVKHLKNNHFDVFKFFRKTKKLENTKKYTNFVLNQ